MSHRRPKAPRPKPLLAPTGALLCLLLGAMAPASAQSAFPSKPIRIVSPFGAGGSSDTIARVLQNPLQQALGQPVVVENRPGAGSNIGTASVARAEPDGYTLLLTTSAFVANPSLYATTPFDPIRDFTPVADLADAANVLVATPQSGIKSLAELIERAKAAPGTLNCATAGVGTSPHLSLELLKLRAGVQITHIPYPGGGPALQAALSGTTELFFSAMPNVHPHLQSGALRGIGIASAKRWPDLPALPTFIEAGMPDFVTETFHVLLAPAGTPANVVDRLAQATRDVLRRPEIQERLLTLGFAVVGNGPELLKARIAREVPFYRDLITQAKLRIE